MASLGRELVFLILQYLDEEKFKDTIHKLEKESGVYFDMSYFEGMLMNGEWGELEKYLLGFTKFEDNPYSKKIFFEIYKQKYLEALDRRDHTKAVEILLTNLKSVLNLNEELYKDLALLLTLNNFRENEQLSMYGDTRSSRAIILVALKRWIKKNPLFQDKLQFPSFKSSRLRTLINQSLNWQHQLCMNPRSNPDITTLFVDHMCEQSNEGRAPSPIINPRGAHGVNNMHMDLFPTIYPGQSQTPMNSPNDLPKTVVANLNQGSAVTSMDFHPSRQSLLLVGTNAGEVSIWEVVSKEKIVQKNFEVDLPRCSGIVRAAMEADCHASVNRVMWSPDGSLLGAAYSNYIVHLFLYHGGSDLHNHLQIEAHVGSVNDLAFVQPDEQLCVVTCGEDKAIKVWNAANGIELYAFKGHEAPVYSVYPYYKENTHFILSTTIDGKIKAWFYNNKGFIVDCAAPGCSRTTMAYNANGTRLFSCGTNNEGEPFLVEWDDGEGSVKRSYIGLGKRSLGVVQFDTTRNMLLAAGDESVIKFWDMDNVSVLTTTDAEGGLPASPCIRFNKDGVLLAVSTSDNGIKVLANEDGVLQVRSFECRALNGENRSLLDANPLIDKFKSWRPTEINDPSQLRSIRLPLPDHVPTARIMRLMYTNSGSELLALAYNAIHKLWKWKKNERNVAGKATASVAPHFWIPKSGILMTNELGQANPEEAVPCFALTKNDSYVMSTSGGKFSLFNMITFKTLTTLMSPPPAATSLVFHPHDNNIIVIGMDDSTIKIYNVQSGEVFARLRGHGKRVTGLAFSNLLNILVSAGADSQLCVWSDKWKKQASKFLQMPTRQAPKPLSHTRVQFHHDQVHVLAVHETQVAIYKAPKLEVVKQWFSPRESSGSITDAGYSCDSQSIYVSFKDARVAILDATTLTLRCMIKPSAYLLANPSNKIHPVAVATHPSEPNQFALGLTNGGVHVFEPLEPETNWGNPPPAELSAGPSARNATGASDQQSR